MEIGPCADGPTRDETVARCRRAARRVPAAAIEHLGGAFVVVEGYIVAAQHEWLARSLATFRDARRVGRTNTLGRARKHGISQVGDATEGAALLAVMPIKYADVRHEWIQLVLGSLARRPLLIGLARRRLFIEVLDGRVHPRLRVRSHVCNVGCLCATLDGRVMDLLHAALEDHWH